MGIHLVNKLAILLKPLKTNLKNCLNTFPNPTRSLLASVSTTEFEQFPTTEGFNCKLQLKSTLLALSLGPLLWFTSKFLT